MGERLPQLDSTVAAWKAAQKQIADFNVVLAKNHLQELNVAPTELGDPTCTFKAGSK